MQFQFFFYPFTVVEHPWNKFLLPFALQQLEAAIPKAYSAFLHFSLFYLS